MSDTVREGGANRSDGTVLLQLSTLDRFLPVWIFPAMGLGLVLGRLVPGLDDALEAIKMARLAADRGRPARDDVPGARQGGVRRARSRLGRAGACLRPLLLNWVLGPG